MAMIELRNVSKSFGAVSVCKDVSLAVAAGEFVTLLGPSGCGKTTTLNMVAGLEDPTEGDILIGGERVNDRSPVERDVAMVFQNYALYPHMTVAENIGFTLRMRKLGHAEIAIRVKAVAEALELTALLDRLPSSLSGGQQQRVAIGRALVREPKLFLFDEPFSNLDASLRVKMRAEVKQLHQRLGVTTLFVTHDQEEAMAISDRIAVINRGRVEQFATPEEIYARPANSHVARFIGNPQIDLIAGTVAIDGDNARIEVGGIAAQQRGQASVPLGIDAIALPGAAHRFTHGQAIELGIRPEHVRLADYGMPARVRLVQPMGPATHVTLDWAGSTLVASISGFVHLGIGSAAYVAFDPGQLLIFDQETGRRL